MNFLQISYSLINLPNLVNVQIRAISLTYLEIQLLLYDLNILILLIFKINIINQCCIGFYFEY